MNRMINAWILGTFSLLGLAACTPATSPDAASATGTPPASAASRSIAANLQPMDALNSLTCEMPSNYPDYCKPHWTTKHAIRALASGTPDTCDDQKDKKGCARKVEVAKVVETLPGSKDPIAYCTAKFSYDRLTTPHKKGANSADTKVAWTLNDPAGLGAEFATDAAPSGFGTGIALSGSSASPAKVWETLPLETNGSRVVIKIKANIDAAQEFCHYPRVKVKGLGECCPGDPIIINDPS